MGGHHRALLGEAGGGAGALSISIAAPSYALPNYAALLSVHGSQAAATSNRPQTALGSDSGSPGTSPALTASPTSLLDAAAVSTPPPPQHKLEPGHGRERAPAALLAEEKGKGSSDQEEKKGGKGGKKKPMAGGGGAVKGGRYWSPDEHQRFVEGMSVYGVDYVAVSSVVGTRSAAQVRSHSQKFFKKLIKHHQKGLQGLPSMSRKKPKLQPELAVQHGQQPIAVGHCGGGGLVGGLGGGLGGGLQQPFLQHDYYGVPTGSYY